MQICTVLNALSPSNKASKCSSKLCYGKISFIAGVPELASFCAEERLTYVGMDLPETSN